MVRDCAIICHTNFKIYLDGPGDAFRVAYETDPQAKLYLLDGSSEEEGRVVSDALYNLAARLVKDGVPIESVGLDGHLFISQDNIVHASDLLPYVIKLDPTNGLTGVAANVEMETIFMRRVAR